MKKKSLFLGGALMFAMTFSTTVLTSCHDDDKKYEEVEDPLRSQTAYYIAGTITDANGAIGRSHRKKRRILCHNRCKRRILTDCEQNRHLHAHRNS
ncbi:hypothetical protein NXU89_12580 [Bacteroides uniformis]|nr:hypothetical protein [Bacteroides uniformis]